MTMPNAMTLLSCTLAALAGFTGPAVAEEPPIEATVSVDAGTVLRTMDPKRLGGTNVAMWYYPATYDGALKWMPDLGARYIRIPGGSWANGIYWNGHGVRGPDGKVDPTKVGPDGYPAVDYSDYAPSFRVNEKTLHPKAGDWHGHSDVKKQHDFIKAIPGAQAMACPNAGTGRAVDAAEWVRWANKKMGYDVRMWEIGNELGGSWEAGTEMPLGKGPLTAEIYTARYNEMATAMRQVDPTIKIGSSPYVQEVLRDCGDNVDFVSQHTYPGSTTLSEAQMFSDIAASVEREIGPIKKWIRQYQPDREGQIEIAYSEWNLAGGLDNAKMFSGLWSSIFLGEIAKSGVSMATQWDAFSDLFSDDKSDYARKSQYYALSLWNNYMGDRLVPASSSNEAVYAYASRTDDAVIVMLVNTDPERDAMVNVQLSGFTPAAAGELATVTSREYYYNPLTRRPQWSTGPRIEPVTTGPAFEVALAPFSMTYVRVPDQARPELSPMARKALAQPPAATGTAELRLVLPDEVYAGDMVRGDVIALAVGSQGPYAGTLAPAVVSAKGIADVPVRIAEAVGHFALTPATPGDLTVTATAGDVTTNHTIKVKPSIPRPIVFFDFSKPPLTDKEFFDSDYGLSEDLTQRANRAVARADLTGQTGVGHKGTGLLAVRRLPEAEKLDKSNIRGVIADVKTSADLVSDDPDAHIMVVMQSPANWWMHLGSIPLKADQDWKTWQFDVSKEEHLQAIPTAGNILFILQSSKPAKGSVYIDRIGFMVR